YKHYGHTVERMIEKALAMSSPENRQRMALSIANFMKMAYVTWNKDTVQDEHILQNLAELSKGELVLPAETVLTKLDFKTPPPGSRTKSGGAASNNANQKNNQKSGGKKNSVKKKNGSKKSSYRK